MGAKYCGHNTIIVEIVELHSININMSIKVRFFILKKIPQTHLGKHYWQGWTHKIEKSFDGLHCNKCMKLFNYILVN